MGEAQSKPKKQGEVEPRQIAQKKQLLSERDVRSKIPNPESRQLIAAPQKQVQKKVPALPKKPQNNQPSLASKQAVKDKTKEPKYVKPPPKTEVLVPKEPSGEVKKPPAWMLSQPIHQGDFVEVEPRESIPFSISSNASEVKLEMSKCMYFKQGHNNLYTHDLMQLWRAGQNWSEWISVTTGDHTLKSKIDVLKSLQISREEIINLSKLGTFVLAQYKWGFIIQLSRLDCIYEGDLNGVLIKCIQIPFFQKLLKRYAYYMLEDKSISLRDLLSTENDRRLSEQELVRCEILFAHQKEEVGWMLNLQRHPFMKVEVNTLIPLFDSGYYLDPTDSQIRLRKLKDLKEECIQKVHIQGAILASDIGSGKTASMLYLIYLSHLFERTEKPTLIVTPDSILFQWAEEINKFTPSLRYQIAEKAKDIESLKLLKGTQVILVPRSALNDVKKNSLLEMHFKRVILDEVHEIVKTLQKDNNLNSPSYFMKYNAEMIWGVTGTPHQVDYLSNLAVLGRLLRFPWRIYDELNIEVFRRCFLEYCIRKNANTELLPPVIKELVYSQMQAVDSVLYSAKAAYSLDEEQARKICFNILPAFELRTQKSSIQDGISVVKHRLNHEIEKAASSMKEYSQNSVHQKQLQEKLHRLTSENNFYSEVIKILTEPMFECFICIEDKEIKDLVLTECFHYCCDECYEMFFKSAIVNQCPVCKALLSKEKAIIHPNMKHSKNKIQRIMEALGMVKKGQKVIIFTQFHNLVERMAQEFQKAEVPYLQLRGEPTEINYRLNLFRRDPDIMVLLLSIEQAASGINLTEANHVFFAHPLLGNDYLTMIRTYQQCIGRVHRIGQTKNVSAKLFVGTGTLEASYHNYFLSNKK